MEFIVATKKCNSNCIYCPEPDNFRKSSISIDEEVQNTLTMINSQEIFPSNLVITGGEPTLLKEKLFIILDNLKNKYNETDFLLITNGRMFYYKDYSEEFKRNSPSKMIVGIAIHSFKEEIHDEITEVRGSFFQTVTGIKNLLQMKCCVEIRVVVNKLNYNHLNEISNFIYQNFPTVYRVVFMGMEITGNAFINKERIWIDYEIAADKIEAAIMKLLNKGINSLVYNIPLCFMNREFWQLMKQSITPYKVRYFEACNICQVKGICSGFFGSTIKHIKKEIKPICER